MVRCRAEQDTTLLATTPHQVAMVRIIAITDQIENVFHPHLYPQGAIACEPYFVAHSYHMAIKTHVIAITSKFENIFHLSSPSEYESSVFGEGCQAKLEISF